MKIIVGKGVTSHLGCKSPGILEKCSLKRNSKNHYQHKPQKVSFLLKLPDTLESISLKEN